MDGGKARPCAAGAHRRFGHRLSVPEKTVRRARRDARIVGRDHGAGLDAAGARMREMGVRGIGQRLGQRPAAGTGGARSLRTRDASGSSARSLSGTQRRSTWPPAPFTPFCAATASIPDMRPTGSRSTSASNAFFGRSLRARPERLAGRRLTGTRPDQSALRSNNRRIFRRKLPPAWRSGVPAGRIGLTRQAFPRSWGPAGGKDGMRRANEARLYALTTATACALALLAGVIGAPTRAVMQNLVFDQYQRWKPRPYAFDQPVRIVADRRRIAQAARAMAVAARAPCRARRGAEARRGRGDRLRFPVLGKGPRRRQRARPERPLTMSSPAPSMARPSCSAASSPRRPMAPAGPSRRDSSPPATTRRSS